MADLRIAKGFGLPHDYITQTGAILAVRGAGKSNLAAVIAEEMTDAGLPWVAVDPVGSWYGVRAPSSGRGSGLAVPIFGGRHGDVPLERGAGELLADLVVDERLTCVLDVSELSESAKTAFLIDFAGRLYQRNTDPLHLFLEEADDYCPQKPFREQARLVRAWENVVRRGRARGLGMTMITQRSAALNKNVLTQIETLFAMRTTSPQDRAAVKAWIESQGAERDVLETLPKLQAGEAWVWSPAWRQTCKRVKVRRRRTYDSGATPTQKGRKRAAMLADVNLEAITAAMSDVIERAEAEDPKALRARIAELERDLEAERARKPVERVEVPVFADGQVDALREASVQAEATSQRALESFSAAVELLKAAMAHDKPARTAPTRAAKRPAAAGDSGRLPKVEKKVLTALAQHGPLSLTQAAMIAGYSAKSGGMRNAAGALRTKGYVDGGNAQMTITTEGEAVLGAWDPLPVGAGLAEHWYRQLGKAEREILRQVVRAYPREVSLSEAAAQAGYSVSSGGVRNAAGKLRTLMLVEGTNAGLKASGTLV